MNQKELSLLLSYIYNNRIRLENEVSQLQSNIRFRKVDVPDCLELLVAITQLETFKEITDQVLLLLDLRNSKAGE